MQAPSTEPRVAQTQTATGYSAPSRARKPASGKITSDGIGGTRFSRSTSTPTPIEPSPSRIEKIQSVISPPVRMTGLTAGRLGQSQERIAARGAARPVTSDRFLADTAQDIS